MQEVSDGPISFFLPLEPLSYHMEIVRHLQEQECDLWKWFAADRSRQQASEAVRLELLKSTYRIESQVNTSLYTAVEEVSKTLGLDMPVTCYQSQGSGGMNASLAYLPGEAHIVFVGPVLSALTALELRSLLGHELAHFALLDRWPDYLIASQLLAAMTNDAAVQSSHVNSARFFKLYTEVYSDRGSYLASRDLGAVITTLVKAETGMTEVSADSYLRQSDEIFQKGHPCTEGVTHPEMFIRAKALSQWVREPETAAGQIRQIIEGPLALEELDLLAQQRLSSLTRRLIDAVLKPAWIRTESMLGHAKLFFDDYKPGTETDVDLAADLRCDDAKTRDYFCYILLDFASADRDLEEAPLAAALLLSDELGLGERFRQLAAKELNLRKKQIQTLETDAGRIVAQASEGEG